MTTRARAVYEIRAVDKTRAAVSSAQGNLRRLDRTVKQFASGLGAGIGLAAVTTVVDRVTSDAQSLDQALQNFDFRLDEWQKFNIAADQAGVGIKQLETSFQRMARRVSQAADGTGEAQEALRELNLDAAKLEQLSIADQFDAITRAVEPLARPDKIRILQKIFDSEGVKAVLDTTRAMGELGSSFDDILLKQSQLDNLLLGKTWIDNFSSEIKLLTAGAIANFIGQFEKLISLSKDLDIAVVRMLENLGLEGFDEVLGVEELEKVNAKLKDAEANLGSIMEAMEAVAATDVGQDRFERLNEVLEEQKDIYDELLERRRELERFIAAPGGRGVDPSRPNFYAPGTVTLDGEAVPTGTAAATRAARRSIGDFPDPQQIVPFMGPVGVDPADMVFLDAEGKAIEVASAIDEVTDAERRAQSAAEDLGFTFSSAFEDAIVNAEDLQTVVQGLIQDIARIVLRQTVTGPLAGGISDFFAPKALGGPVTAGGGYLVGERGPELFVPRSSGSIVPNNKLGGGGTNVTFNVNAMDSQSVLGAIAQHKRQIVGMVREGYAQRGSRVDL